MNRIKKTLLIAGTAASVGMGSLGVVGMASAATDSTSGSTSIIDKLVTKFGLNKDEVQAVFDAERSEHQAMRLTNIKDRLATAVTDGKLTQAQSDAILSKYTEFQTQREANRESMKDMTDDERKAAMEANRTAFETWLTDNDIPTEFARLIHMGGHGHGGPGGNMAQ